MNTHNDPLLIEVGDKAGRINEMYNVTGILAITSGRHSWKEILLDDHSRDAPRRTWFSVDDLGGVARVVIWSKITATDISPASQAFTLHGERFTLQNRSKATYTSTGTPVYPESGSMVRYDYISNDGRIQIACISFDDEPWTFAIGYYTRKLIVEPT